MNNKLQIQNNNNVQTIDSREVAEMMGKRHDLLLREIDGSKDGKTVGIIPTLENANFVVSNYFIESTYKSGTREYKCYLVTKLGCEILGNKQQGEKGILFTAKYVERFNQMEQALKDDQPKLPRTYKEALMALIEAEEEKERIEAERLRIEEEKKRLTHHSKLYTATEIAKELGFRSAIEFNQDLKEKKIQYKVNNTWVLAARYAECGYVSIKQNELENGIVTYDRKWTGLGRDWLVNEVYHSEDIELLRHL